MHVVILTAGSAGDVHPFIGLGRALRDRGHEVELVVNEMFAELVRASGLGCIEFGTRAEFDQVTNDPNLWHPIKGLKLVLEEGVVPALEPVLDTLLARVRPDTVLVSSTLGFAARIANEIANVPLASVHLAPSVFRSVYRMPRLPGPPMPDWAPRFWKRLFWRISDWVIDPMLAPAINTLRAKHGLAPVKRVFGDWMHSKDLIVGLFPDWFGPPQPDWPDVELTGFPLFDAGETYSMPAELDEWLDHGPPPVVFTAGSANVLAHAFFHASVEACRGRRAVLVTSDRRSVPATLPDTVRWASYVPFGALLPRSAALVSHGGIGTIAQGIAAGIPQVVAPMAFDQFDNASRLVDLGVGAVLPMTKYTATRARRALDRIEGASAAAQALRDRLPSDPVGDTAALIEKL